MDAISSLAALVFGVVLLDLVLWAIISTIYHRAHDAPLASRIGQQAGRVAIDQAESPSGGRWLVIIIGLSVILALLIVLMEVQ